MTNLSKVASFESLVSQISEKKGVNPYCIANCANETVASALEERQDLFGPSEFTSVGGPQTLQEIYDEAVNSGDILTAIGIQDGLENRALVIAANGLSKCETTQVSVRSGN